MPDADGFLNYREALVALMRHIDQRVMVSAAGHDDADAGLIVQATGTLTAGWDPRIMEANQAGDVAIFRLADAEVSFFLDAETFRYATSTGDSVRIRMGNVDLTVEPPMLDRLAGD